jgi:hypothetical protein
VAASAAIGCGLPPNPARPEVFTMADLEVLAATPGATFAEGAGIPGGLRIGDYLKVDDNGKYQLALRTTWTETYRSAYVTGEIWKGFDEVWVQPVYVPVTGFDARGVAQELGDSPIFSVGPDSAFYSPFWRVFYFQVPPGTKSGAFKSARDVIDSELPLIEGPNRTMSLVPGDVLPPEAPEDSNQHIGGPTKVESGYLDGQPVSYLDFGESNFSWNDDLVVEETPLFVLFYRTASGDLAPLNVPTVAGTGPLYANRPANVVGSSVPHYGAYWRLYTVVVPSTARIYAPVDVLPQTRMKFESSMIGPTYTLPATTPKDLPNYVGRVALNPYAPDGAPPGCFDNYNLFETHDPAGCLWLDSQGAIEALIPQSLIQRTDILVTCPFVSYRDAAVPVGP